MALATALALCTATSMATAAAEPFGGQRALLQQTLDATTAQGQPPASALAAARLGAGEPEVLLLGHVAHGGAPLGSDARFELGSVTKALTGSLLAQLAVQGRVGLDDPVGRWVPELAGTPAAALTLRQLATHQSGLPRVPMSARFVWSMLRDPGDPYRHYAESDMLVWLRNWQAPAQTAFAYSNLGFALLGLALERAAAQPLARLMDEQILRPAGAVGATLEAAGAASQIQGYDDKGRPTPPWTIGAFAGAGALRANTVQMLALLDAARQRRPPFDVGAEKEQARRHAFGGVGLGWMRTDRHGDRIVWHNGGTGGFRSFFGYSELSGRAVLLMVNGQVDLDSLGLHLINPAFEPAPAAAPARSGPGAWVAAVLALCTLASLAWRAWRPRSRLEQALEAVLGGALLALAWRLTPAMGLSAAVPVAVGALALAAVVLMAWRGRHHAAWPARRRTMLFALLNAALGVGLVAWLW
jgi:CubicO group peptidase (beta-lactamase class C family)